MAGHAGVALTNTMAFEEVVRQRAHERAVIDASAGASPCSTRTA